MADPGTDNPTFQESESAWTEVDTANTALSEAEKVLESADDDARSEAEQTLTDVRKTHGEKLTVAREATKKAISEAMKLGTASPKDWRETLPEEQRKGAQKFSSVPGLYKSYTELEAKLGSAINIPDENASDEDLSKFWNRLGRPETADKYALYRPEGIKEEEVDDGWKSRESSFATMAHTAGLTQSQVDQNIKWFYAETAAVEEARIAAEKTAQEEQQVILDKEWGDDKEANIKIARIARKAFGSDEFDVFLEGKKVDGVTLGDHPAFVRVFANIGRLMKEDTLVMGMPEDQKKSIQERIDELAKLQSTDREKYTSKEVQSELAALNLKLHGTGDATGPARATLIEPTG